MKRWHKIAISVIAVLAITMGCFRLAAPQVFGIGYPHNTPKPSLSYRITWLLGKMRDVFF